MKKIAFIGLGAMGSRMARRLIDAGHTLVVYNRSKEPVQALQKHGAQAADTPRAAAAEADIVMSMLTDDEVSQHIWLDENDGAIHGLRAGAIALASSTLSPAYVRKLGEKIKAKGAGFLDAPVVGTRPHAEGGLLTYLVGGKAEILAEVKDVLAVMGTKIHHIGAIGTGATMKLSVNALFAIQVASLGEILSLLHDAGIEKTSSVAVLNELPITSPVAMKMGEMMQSAPFNPNFPISLVEKDLRYCRNLGNISSSQTPVVNKVHKVFQDAKELGLGGDDISGIVQLYSHALKREAQAG